MRFLLILLISLFLFSPALPAYPRDEAGKPADKVFTKSLFYQEPEGWLWYREKEVEEQKEEEKKEKIILKSPLSITEWKVEELRYLPSDYLALIVGSLSVEKLRELAKILLDQAMEPQADYEDVRKYMVVHREVLTRSGTFARRWQDVLMADAYFDFPAYYIPLSSPAQDIWAELKSERREKEMAEIARKTRLVFFRDDDPYSQKQEETLDKLADKYGFEVVPVSRWEAEGKGWNVGRYPSVFLYLSEPEGVIRLGSGYMVYTDLKRRIIRGYQVLSQPEPYLDTEEEAENIEYH